MFYRQKIRAAIFDMDGLLIDSEPLWTRAELDVFSAYSADAPVIHHHLPDTTGLRIDQVVHAWFAALPELTEKPERIITLITDRVLALIEQSCPLLPGVETALKLCQQCGLRIGLASASPSLMIQRVLDIFSLTDYFSHIVSAERLPYSKPHPQIYLNTADALGVDPINCVTLEDSIFGMIATKAACMRSIVVPVKAQFGNPRWSLADVKLASLDAITVGDLLGE